MMEKIAIFWLSLGKSGLKASGLEYLRIDVCDIIKNLINIYSFSNEISIF